MYILKSISEFVNEESNISKIRAKLAKSVEKIDSYQTKSRAASEEVAYRKDQLEYEQTKETMQNQRDAAQNPVEKAQAQEDLQELKKNWKLTKKDWIDRITNLRNAS